MAATTEASAVPRLLYRHMLRTCRRLTANGPMRLLTSVFDCEVQWMRPPQFRLLAPADSAWEERVDSQHSIILEKFPSLTTTLGGIENGLTRDQVQQLLRHEFEAQRHGEDGQTSDEHLDHLFAAYRELQDQLQLAELSSSAVSGDVRVDATSGYLGCDRQGMHVFQYHIAITNVGSRTVQLLSRHWVITNADGSVEATVPRGSPGVVGQRPLIHPSQCFEYASGITLRTPGGQIRGSFQMTYIDDGQASDSFDAEVAPFACSAELSAGAAPRRDGEA